MQDPRTAYTADRAAALAGVPKSTVHYWARTDLLVPSVSPDRIKLWSYSDVVGLRIIGWLRQTKQSRHGHDIPPTRLPMIRQALSELRATELDLWNEHQGTTVLVDPTGKLHLRRESYISDLKGQKVAKEWLDLMAPFDLVDGQSGPDLKRPRPSLRIVPGKLAGAPHVANTRIETISLAALAARGFQLDQIQQLYPSIDEAAVTDALDLEGQLARNLAAA